MKNEYTVTKSEYVVLERKAILLGSSFIRFLWLIFGALWIGGIFFFNAIVQNPSAEITLCALCAAYCAYKAFLEAFVRAFFRYKILSKRAGAKEWKRTVTLNESNIAVTDGESTEHYEYSHIKEIAKIEGFIAVITIKKEFIWLSDSGFVDCTRNDFLAKLVVKQEMAYENLYK